MAEAAYAPRVWKPPPLIRGTRLRWVLIVGAVAYLVVAIGSVDVN